MTIWQVDFYRRPLQDDQGQPLWELVICSPDKTFAAYGVCPQPEVTTDWVVEQLQQLGQSSGLPERMEVFRPQCLSLLQVVGDRLRIPVIPTRRTPALKQYLQDRAQVYPTLPQYNRETYDPLALESPPPVPVPDELWGDRWRFATVTAGEWDTFFQDKPIPVRDTPADLDPVNLQLASSVTIPGVVIDGGRQSMRLTRWLQEQQPVALNYIAGDPDGLILAVGLCDRLILATFDDPDVRTAATTYQQRLATSNGLHFLLIQPDDSGMTYSGLWWLRSEE
ncbi:MAG: DUF1092 family protein [Cyanothece sp. SIO2G6]|nr:DUF1092 family protein [Cyanothece sp. SIO2G6]